MKTLAAILTICVILLLGFMLYLKEEPPPPPPKRILKFKIVKPPKQQKPEEQKAQIPGEQEKEEITAKESEEGKAAVGGETPKKELAAKPVARDEKPAQEVAKEEGAAERKAEKVKTALAKKIPKKKIEPVKPAGIKEKPAQRSETVIEKEEMEKYYIVNKGESLYDVASRDDVYGNKLKWPVLYRLNIDTLANLKTEKYPAERELPPGLKLRIISSDEVENNLKKRQNRMWVVNALSISTDGGEIIPLAITLMRNGYNAYLAQATLKGKEWTRLRVGFFASRAEADAEKEKIKDLLQVGDPWSTKLTEEEFEEFAGY